MNKTLIIPITALAVAGLACSPIHITVNVPRVTTGPTQTLTVSEPLPDTKAPTSVSLVMTAGRLNLAGGADGLIDGTVQYNVPDWEPTVTTDAGSFTLQQGPNRQDGFPDDNVINDWKLKLGNTPLNLDLRVGAYKGNLDLSGVPLTNLEINEGVSDSQVTFDTLNPAQMDHFSYHSGAAQTSLSGLANANFKSMDFNGGAGSYTLDFSGTLQQDATVTVDAGVGNIRLIVPNGTAATVFVNHGIGSVESMGNWTASGDTYTTPGTGHTLTITIKMGVGSLELHN